MSVSPRDLGITLARRRTTLRYQPHDVERLVGISAERLVEIESGRVSPSLYEVEQLGRALVFDPSDLLSRGELPDPRRLPGWFESHTDEESETSIHPDDIRLTLLAAECSEIGSFLLEELYGRSQPKLLEAREPSGIREPEADGKQLGAKKRAQVDALRSSSDGASGPIDSVQGLLESLDVHVADVPLSTNRKGAISIVRPGLMPVILVNSSHSKTRRHATRRMILAHEIAHVLLDGGEQEIGGTPHERQRDVEVRAKNFAPNFLAPPDSVRDSVAGLMDQAPFAIVGAVARSFGLSYEAAAWHSANCGVIDTRTARGLIESTERRRSGATPQWESIEHVPDPEERGIEAEPHPLVYGLLQRLVMEAFQRSILSAGRVREILEVR